MNELKIGDIVKAEITGITEYGIFVKLENNYKGLVHISEISDKFVKNIETKYKPNEVINVLIMDINNEDKQLKLSIKKIDYNERKDLSKIPEPVNGFEKLHSQLKIWTEKKIKEISE